MQSYDGTGYPGAAQQIGGESVRVAAPARLRVLVAEDHEISRELAGMMAARLGVDVEVACDGLEAIDMVERAKAADTPYAIVLMDIQMPLMDGLEATRQLRCAGHDPDSLPIVAVTASANPENVAACLAAGMQAHLSKPARLADLQAVFDTWSSRPQPVKGIAGPASNPGLQARYEQRKRDTLARIETALLGAETGAAATGEILVMLHKLAGTAGYFGEAALSNAMAELEAELAAAPGEKVLGVLSKCRRRLAGRG